MPIPRRFSPPNPARDMLDSQVAALPPEQRAQVESAMPGASTVSLANPAGVAGIPTAGLGPPTAPLSATVPPPTKDGPAAILGALRGFSTPVKTPPPTPLTDQLTARKLITVAHGYVMLTEKGLGYLVDFGLI